MKGLNTQRSLCHLSGLFFFFLHSFPLSWQILWYWIICVIMSLRRLCTRHGAWEKKQQQNKPCCGLNGKRKCLKAVMSRCSLLWNIVAVLRQALTKHTALKRYLSNNCTVKSETLHMFVFFCFFTFVHVHVSTQTDWLTVFFSLQVCKWEDLHGGCG